jgi:flavin-dependent dehydrogenase
LVLGLGPAGSTYILSAERGTTIYAYDLYLARHGRTRSCCAGGLGFAAIDELREALPGRVWGVVERCMYRCVETYVSSFRYAGEEVSVAIDRHDLGLGTLGLVLDRQCFDMCLAGEALRRVVFEEVKPEDRVVYATGYSHPPPVPRRDLEVVVQQWLDVAHTSDEIVLSILKRYSRVGYFWVFPEMRSGLLKVGVGESLDNLLRRRVTIRQVLEKFKERLSIEGKVVRECGAVLPLGRWREKYMGRGGDIYIGTAGGFINPLTGAGIKLAILSGYAVAVGDVELIKRMKREINRSYAIKGLLRLLPQRRIDSAMEFLYRARGWFDKKKMFGFRNVALAVLALL